jgi:hypothetical protein
VLFDARLDGSSQFRMSGAEIAKTGQQTYHFEKGRFTTCRCPDGGREPWEIKADRADLEIGGYGTARNTSFEVLGVPVAWLPWMLYPLKTERQTGLLFPLLSVGSIQGFSAALPFFWAARENVNVLITPGWSVKRGPPSKAAAVRPAKVQRERAGAYHHDTEIDASASEPFGRDRWATWGEQDAFLPAEVRAKTQFVFASDNQYPSDYRDLGDYRNDRFLQSTAFAGRDFGADGRFALLAAADYAGDLQSPDDLDRDKYLLQRLPQLSFAMLPPGMIERLIPALGVGTLLPLEEPTRPPTPGRWTFDAAKGTDGSTPMEPTGTWTASPPGAGSTDLPGGEARSGPARLAHAATGPSGSATTRNHPEAGWSQALCDSDALISTARDRDRPRGAAHAAAPPLRRFPDASARAAARVCVHQPHGTVRESALHPARGGPAGATARAGSRERDARRGRPHSRVHRGDLRGGEPVLGQAGGEGSAALPGGRDPLRAIRLRRRGIRLDRARRARVSDRAQHRARELRASTRVGGGAEGSSRSRRPFRAVTRSGCGTATCATSRASTRIFPSPRNASTT